MRLPRWIGLIVLAVVTTTALLPSPASAGPVYRDPPGYKGIKKAPKTKPPVFPTAALSNTGTFPNLLVDEAGTAHIVWNEGRGNADDAAIYCRLKRGATGCDARRTLVWNKSYGPGDGPQFNTDDGGPRIVRVGDQLVVLSKRYPTIGEKPDGASSSTVVGWVSNDGGSSWSNAQVLGKWNLGQLAVTGPSDDPTIINLGFDPLCGGMCLTAYKSGVYAANQGLLNTDPNSNYNATLTNDGAALVGAFSDLNPRIWLRRWKGTGPVTDAGSWSTSAPIPGDEPDLAGGPGGTYLMHRPGFSGAYQVRPLTVGAQDKVVAGAATPISEPSGARFGRLAEDASGRLLAAWQQEGSGLQLRTSTSGAGGFAPAQRLIDGGGNGQIELDAYRDGGGFSVLNHTGGVNSPGQITAIGFGNRAATGRAGLGSLPGGAGDVSCQRIGFGRFSVETVEGCFLKGTGKSAGVVVTGGAVNLNGLRIVPDPGSRLVIDPEKLTINTIGDVRVLVGSGPTEIVLYHGEFHRDLAGLKPGSRLFEFPLDKFQANVLGFDVAAGLPVILTENGVRIPVDLELPSAFGGFTGHAELIVDRTRGLVLDSLKIHIGPVPLGVLIVESIDLDYKSGGTWTGAGELTVPAGGSLAANFRFDMGEFGGAGFDYTLAPPATIGPFVYLLSVGGDFSLRPTTIAARAAIGAGAAVQGEAPVRVRGQFTMKFPSAAPASFNLTGKVDLFVIQIGEGYLEFQSDGYAEFGGATGLALGPLSGGVNVEGFVDGTTGKYGADVDGNAKFCLDVDVPPPVGTVNVCGGVGAQAAVSSIGFAACARINPPDPIGGFSAGLAMRWDDLSPAVLASPIVATAELIRSIAIPCSTAAYRIPQPRKAEASRAGAEGLAIPAGLPSATVLIEGAGSAPDVALRGPGGQTIGAGGSPKDGFIAGVPGADAVWAVIEDPQGGTWTVVPKAESPEISEVLLSEGYKPASVTAKVSRGKIAYRAKNLGHGQKVSFRESGRFGTKLLDSVARKRGTLKFKPAPGAGGKRKVVALISRDGLVTEKVPVGSYRAPPPRPPKGVKRLRARKHGSALTVSFRAPKGAARTEVLVRGSDGTKLARLLEGRKHKARFGAVRWQRRLKVSVRSFSKEGRPGPRKRLVIRSRR